MLAVTSSQFREQGPLPARFTCDGEGVSPPLEWTGAPEGTASFALILDDPDAPRGRFVHWLVYDIPAAATKLEADAARQARTGGFKQGRTTAGKVEYTPPCPPRGSEHRYVFTLYALDAPLGLEPGASAAEVREAMEGHILAEAQLVSRYSRTR
ncbi:MAG: YbhB/YbcL family Raf kinase inhibitor-like protein [Anaerolineae bacterium]